MADLNLPDWATLKGRNGESYVIDVDAPAAYEALLSEYREHYEDNVPAEWLTKEESVRKEWADALDDLASDEPSAYWLEVAYQSIKLDLQIACRTFALNISIHDPEKAYRQEGRRDGRDVKRAAGGLQGGKEAREHYKRLRGFLPA